MQEEGSASKLGALSTLGKALLPSAGFRLSPKAQNQQGGAGRASPHSPWLRNRPMEGGSPGGMICRAGNSWPSICCDMKSGKASARLKKYGWERFLNTQNREKNPNPTTAGHRTATLDWETEKAFL